MEFLVNEVDKTLSFEEIAKILKANDPVILCKLYHPHYWSWCRLNNKILSGCALEALFDGDMSATNISRTLEIVSGREKEIGYFRASDLASLLVGIQERAKKIGLNDAEFEAHFFDIFSPMKDHTDSIPGYKRLLTEEIVNALPPLRSTTNTHFKQKNVICKLHNPRKYAWYVFEGEFDSEKGYRFLGMMGREDRELRHFYLADLLALIEMGLPIELDTSIFNMPYYAVQSQ